MWLLIDDVRDLNADAIARTPEAGQRLLASGPWACLCLDHDLGAEQTGLDVLHWAIGHDCLPQRVQLVTTNLTARSKMAAALHAAGYNSTDGLTFKHTDGVNSEPLSDKPHPPSNADCATHRLRCRDSMNQAFAPHPTTRNTHATDHS